MKKNGKETMEILEAFDRTKCAHRAAKLVGCDPKTVRRLVARREAGLSADAPIERPRLVDEFTDVVEQLVDGSEGAIRADVAHERLVACGYQGSQRTTRRAVAAAKVRWRVEHARSNRDRLGLFRRADHGPVPGTDLRPERVQISAVGVRPTGRTTRISPVGDLDSATESRSRPS